MGKPNFSTNFTPQIGGGRLRVKWAMVSEAGVLLIIVWDNRWVEVDWLVPDLIPNQDFAKQNRKTGGGVVVS